MARAFIALLFVVAMVFVANAQLQGDECPENMEYTNCGTACPTTCTSGPLQKCTKQCVAGCRCKAGYVLNDKRVCVQPHEC